MESIQKFGSAEFGDIRAFSINGEPWFVGKDVAAALNYKDTADAVQKHVDKEDKGVGETPTPYGNQKCVIINESGLYSLIIGSKLPKAKAFKRWITHDVIPSIRKTGSYCSDSGLSADAVLDAVIRLRDERNAAVAEADRVSKELDLYKKKLSAHSSDTGVLKTGIRDTARLFGIPQKQFIQMMERYGFLTRNSDGLLVSTDLCRDEGLFASRGYSRNGHIGRQTMVTDRGIDFISMFIAHTSIL